MEPPGCGRGRRGIEMLGGQPLEILGANRSETLDLYRAEDPQGTVDHGIVDGDDPSNRLASGALPGLSYLRRSGREVGPPVGVAEIEPLESEMALEGRGWWGGRGAD